MLLELLATLYDFAKLEQKSKNVPNRTRTHFDRISDVSDELIVAFSWKRNVSSLIAVRKSSDDIDAVHVIRFLNALMLIVAHKSMALLYLPYINRTALAEVST